MVGRPSTAQDKAKAAYEKSGRTMTALELAYKFKLSPSSIYRAGWFQRVPKTKP